MSEPVDSPSGPAAHPDGGDPYSASRPRLKEMEVIVAEVVPETSDSATLVLFTGNDRLDYQPGHFLTIRPQQFPTLEGICRYFEDVKGRREPARAYSLSSAPHEGLLAITVKQERYVSGVTRYPPLLSPLLVFHTPPGSRMRVTGFGGPYVLPPDIEKRTDHLVHICAGSGIVPNFSILKHCLATGMNLRHTLIYGNRTWGDVIFRNALEELALRHPDRLSIFHALSREPEPGIFGPNVRGGRVDGSLLGELVADPGAVEVFTCGPAVGKYERQAAADKGEPMPPRFLETVLKALDDLGVPGDKIHHESYG